MNDLNGTNSTISPPLPILNALTSTRTVSWQSIVWAVAAIVVNMCLQNCGKVCDFKRNFSILIRVSPVFCALDSLIILFQLLYYGSKQGLRRAIKTVALSRDQHPDFARRHGVKPIWHVIRLLLLTVAVLQSVKLYAFRGIPWTQALCGCFWVSYIVNALLNVFGKPPPVLGLRPKLLPLTEDFVPRIAAIKFLRFTAFIAQLTLWAILGRPTMPEGLLDLSNKAVVVLHIIHLAPCAVLFMVVFTFVSLVLLLPFWGAVLVEVGINIIPVVVIMICLSYPQRTNARNAMRLLAILLNVSTTTTTVVTTILLLTTGVVLRVCFWSWSATIALINVYGYSDTIEHSTLFWVKATVAFDPYGLVLTLTLLALSLSYLIARCFLFGPLSDKLHLRRLSIACNAGWVCLNLFLGNLIFALLYYILAYKPEKTYKPEWIEKLGGLLLQ